MKLIFQTIAALLICTTTLGQGYKINVELPQAAGKNVLLAHYYNSRILISDTTFIDRNGKGVFSADTLLPQGLYKIYLDGKNHFDFLLSADQVFSISNRGFSKSGIIINGAIESEEFVKYMHFLSEQQSKRKAYEEKWKNSSKSDTKTYQAELDKLTEELHSYWKTTAEKFPGTWLETFLMANYVPTLEENKIPASIKKNDSLLLRYKFDYQKQHYFDYFDITDERFLYTPLIKPKIERYFTQILYQTYDSISVGTIELIEKSRANKNLFRLLVSWFLNESINSKIMGMDALFVDIAQKYYLSGEANWVDSNTLEKIRENVVFAKDNLIGNIAPELKLEGIEGEEFFSLHQVDAQLTILLIYEPNCSHCKEFVPALHKEVYIPFKNKGLKVYAIYSLDNKKEWETFVDDHNLYDWINVWDEHHFSRFKIKYDARQTPAIYILNKDKKIVAKKLSIDQVKKIVELELL